jgi:hypothetical protein
MASEKALKNLIGYKIFREKEDGELEIYRIIRYSKSNDSLFVRDENTGDKKYISIDSLSNTEDGKFRKLDPDGLFVSMIVTVNNEGNKFKDVIITTSKVLEVRAGIARPYAICRQSVTDIFYNLLCENESDMIAGLSVNRDDCPTNFDMGIMMICESVNKMESVYFYREDTLDDILEFIDVKKYDIALANMYNTHCRVCGDPKASFKKEHKGWCKNLRLLLKENNFQSDINNMLGITDVSFNIEDFIVEKELPDKDNGNYYSLPDDLILWLSVNFRIDIGDITVLEYDHDINLADLNNTNYFFLRGANKKLFICVYTVKGKFLESDLEEEYNKKDLSSKWRIEFVNKYKEFNK